MKKIISLLVLVCMLFSQFTMLVFGEEVPDSSTYCKELMESLGFDVKSVDGGNVTRGQFIYNLTQILGFKPDASVSELPFTDVTVEMYYASAVKYALDLDIISSSSLFEGERELTYNEACKMLVAALGGNMAAASHGGYPFGYLAEASARNLTDGVPNDEIVSNDTMFIMLDNFLNARLYNTYINYEDAEYTIEYSNGETVLSEYLGLYTVEGIVRATSRSGLYEPETKCSSGKILIGDNEYKYNGTDMLGRNVRAYVNKSDAVVYMHCTEQNIISISSDDIFLASGKTIEYETDSKGKKLTIEVPPAVIYNGKAHAYFKTSDLLSMDADITFIDNDNDRTYDVMEISEYQVMLVESVNTFDIYITDKNGGILRMDDTDVEYIVEKNEVQSELSKIESGDLLQVYASKDKKFFKLVVSSNVISGNVTEFRSDDNIIFIDNVEYKYNNYFKNYYLNSVNTKEKLNFMLTDDNIITAWTSNNKDGAIWGFAIAKAVGNGLDSKLKLKIYNENDELKIYDVAKSVKLNGTSVKQNELYGKLPGAGDNINEMIRFNTNADGQINMIDTQDKTGVLDGTEPVDDNLTVFKYPDNVYSTIYYNITSKMFHPYYRVSDKTKVFIVGDDTLSAKFRYTLTNGSFFSANRPQLSSNLFAYNVTKTGEAEYVLLYDNNGGATIQNTSDSGMVVSANIAVNDDGEIGVMLTLFASGKFSRYFIGDENVLKSIDNTASWNNIPLNKGDIVRFEDRIDGSISAIQRDYNSKDDKVEFAFVNHTQSLSYYYGKVYAQDSSLVNIIPENIAGHISSADDASTRYSFQLPASITVYDRKTKEIYQGTSNDIITYLDDPVNCSKILVNTREGRTYQMYLYK